MPPTDQMIKTFVTFWVMGNLFGNVPVFLALTQGMDVAQRSSVRNRAALAAAITLVISAVVGEPLLAFFGVTTDSLRVAGGLIILLSALGMVRGSGLHKADGEVPSDPAVIPLAIPMFAGPGFIGAVIIAAQDTPGVGPSLVLILMLLVICGLWWLVMSSAGWLGKKLGTSGLDVVTRISGLLLAALAMEMIAAGAQKLLGIH